MHHFVRLWHQEPTPNSSKTSSFFSGTTTSERPRDSRRTPKRCVEKEKKKNQAMESRKKAWKSTSNSHSFSIIFSYLLLPIIAANDLLVDLPSRCESCVIFTKEFEGQAFKSYEKTEAAAIELLENICFSLQKYKIHKDKEGLTRFSRDESLTMSTLKKLKQRGVKVELGMPEELWDSPTAEITELRQQCELIVSEYEDQLTEWFMRDRKHPLTNVICRFGFLKSYDASCLPPTPSEEL